MSSASLDAGFQTGLKWWLGKVASFCPRPVLVIGSLLAVLCWARTCVPSWGRSDFDTNGSTFQPRSFPHLRGLDSAEGSGHSRVPWGQPPSQAIARLGKKGDFLPYGVIGGPIILMAYHQNGSGGRIGMRQMELSESEWFDIQTSLDPCGTLV